MEQKFRLQCSQLLRRHEAIVLGFQHTIFMGCSWPCTIMQPIQHNWRSLAWHAVCAIVMHPSIVMIQLHSVAAIWALYYATSAYGGILARIRMGPSHSKIGVPDSVRKAVADSEELKRSTLLQSFALPHGRMGELPPNTEKSADPHGLSGIPHVMRAEAPVSGNDVLRYILKDMLWSCASELVFYIPLSAFKVLTSPFRCILSGPQRRCMVFTMPLESPWLESRRLADC
ncbi:hypothetical protein WJX77_001865 [Trebouxia sp. C0004]